VPTNVTFDLSFKYARIAMQYGRLAIAYSVIIVTEATTLYPNDRLVRNLWLVPTLLFLGFGIRLNIFGRAVRATIGWILQVSILTIVTLTVFSVFGEPLTEFVKNLNLPLGGYLFASAIPIVIAIVIVEWAVSKRNQLWEEGHGPARK